MLRVVTSQGMLDRIDRGVWDTGSQPSHGTHEVNGVLVDGWTCANRLKSARSCSLWRCKGFQ